eukprot:764324-Hanusia_phi.AAC.1
MHEIDIPAQQQIIFEVSSLPPPRPLLHLQQPRLHLPHPRPPARGLLPALRHEDQVVLRAARRRARRDGEPTALEADHRGELGRFHLPPWALASQQLPHDDGEAVNVAALVELLTSQHLRRHPPGRPRPVVRGRDMPSCALEPGQTEVAHLDGVVGGDEEVVRLEVAVNDGRLSVVQVQQASSGLVHDPDLERPSQPLLPQHVVQRALGQEFCQDGEVGRDSARPDELDHVDMPHPCHDVDLRPELLQVCRCQTSSEAKPLHCHLRPQPHPLVHVPEGS